MEKFFEYFWISLYSMIFALSAVLTLSAIVKVPKKYLIEIRDASEEDFP
jgi:hypothetical protein